MAQDKAHTYRDIVDKVVDHWIGYTIIRFAPLAAPLPAIATLLEASHYAFYIWLTVFGIEFTAYALGDQLVKAVRLGVLSLKQSALGLAVYALAIEGLLLGYKVVPAWAEWDGTTVTIAKPIQASGSVLYPLFTIGGSILFAFHLYLQTVEERRKIAEAKEDQRADVTWEDDRQFRLKRQDLELKTLAKQSQATIKQLSTTLSIGGATVAEQFPAASQESIGKRIVRYYIDNPGAKMEQCAVALGTTVPTVSKEVKTLLADEVLHGRKEGRRLMLEVNGNHQAYLNN